MHFSVFAMFRRLLLLPLFTGPFLVADGADRTLAGSDLLQPALGAAVDAGSLAGVRLRLGGSRGGLEDLRTGRADIAVVAFAPDELPPEGEFRLVPFAYQVAVFVVNESNPVTHLSFSQLGGVFGDKEPTNHRQWGALGGTGVWELKSIAPNLVDDPNSLAVDLFKSTVLHTPVLKATINVQTDADELLRRLRVDDTCIGFFPRPLPDTSGVHVLAVARRDDDVAFGPTPENVATGDYALRLPFHLAFRPDRAGELGPVLRALLGDTVAAELERAGFMAAPANRRTEALAALAGR